MNTVFDPQIIFLYNDVGKIYKTIFLFFGEQEELEKKKIYELFLYFKKQYNIFLNDDYTILNNHILLTLSIYEIRGYIQSEILKTEENILLFSIWDNIDFSNQDGSIFSPFSQNNNYNRVPDQNIIYDVSPRIISNTVFCVLEDKYAKNKKLCSSGLRDNKQIVKFIQDLKQTDYQDKNIEIEIEENNKEIFQIDLTDEFETKIQSLTNFSKNINKYFFDDICITGDQLYYKDMVDQSLKKKDLNFIVVYDKKYSNKIFLVENNMLTIENHILFDNILLTSELRKNVLKQKKNKSHTKLIYNLSFTDNVYIDFEINFFLETTKKTKNIFLDRTKKINIMTSSNHILFSSFMPNYDLYLYITKIIICIQLQNNAVSFLKQDKKLGNRYFSRYCQGERNPKPLNNEKFDTTDYINYNNLFFKNIHNEGDIFYSEERKDYMICDTPGLYNIGFIAEIYEGYNICFPCCYKKIKQNTEIFKTCIGETQEDIENTTIDPYIHIFKQYRIIMNKNKIGFLIGRLNNIFNSNRSYFIQDRHKIKKVTTNRLSFCLKELNKMNIKQYKNTNIFFNLNNQENCVCVYDNNSNPKQYSFAKPNMTDHCLKKEKILYPTTKTTTKFNDIYKSISALDSFIIINSQNRIELAKKYIVYYINQEHKDFKGIDNIYQNDDLIFYIIDDSVYFNPRIIEFYYRDRDMFYKNIQIFLIIQNKVHILKSINKPSYYSNIEMSDLDIKQKRMLIDKLVNIEPIIFNEKNKNIETDYIKTKINNQNYYFFDNTSTKYMYVMDNITLNKESLGYYITDTLYKKYFKIFMKNGNANLNEHKKVFLANLKNSIDTEIEYNKIYKPDKDREIVSKVKSYLNPLYL
ncbi:putative viral early transcription factor large subunit [Yalta virus]|nr:putative viral early transcription factor large subunit [Yalta virus]